MISSQTQRMQFSEAQLAIIPELRYVVDGQVPSELAAEWFNRQRGWPMGLALLLGIAFAPLILLLLHKGFGHGIAISLIVVMAFQLFISWLILGVIAPALQRRKIRSVLREQLRAHGIDACTVCAYDLRGTTDRCPECGAASPSSSEAG